MIQLKRYFYNEIVLKQFYLALSLLSALHALGQTNIINKDTEEPVSYATISFGNGNGIFADNQGKFTFTEKLYSDIDTLYISALGYKEFKIATLNLKETISLETNIDELQEVIIHYKPKGKFKLETLKPTLHEDYFKCWLPTIESEIAVFIPNTKVKPQKIVSVLFPIKVESKDWEKRKKATTKKRPFSTLFRAQFYENKNGFPGDVLTYDEIVFRVTEKSTKIFELDVSANDIFVPKNGLFISIQVLGYTDKAGILLPNKKYQEIKTKRGIVKVSTTFRPLLPFTDKISESRTFVKRVFLNKNQWVVYNKKNIPNSNLLSLGLNNYGIGLKVKVYKNDN